MMKKSALRAFCLVFLPALVALLSLGCPPPVEEIFQPPAGTYETTQNVTINLPNATAIYYTLDGNTPSESCLEYTGTPIEVSSTTVIKVVSVTNGTNSEVISATYNFPGGAGDNSYTNAVMLEAWIEYDAAVFQLIKDKYWDGCEPVTRAGPAPCPGGQTNLGDLGFGYFVEDGAGGTVTMDLEAEGFGGKSTTTYAGYDYDLSGVGILEATAGQVVGHMDASSSGSINTAEGATIAVAGAFNGTIEDTLSITGGELTGGFFEVTCSDADCASGMQTYLVSEGPVFTLYEPGGEGSCTSPYYLIHSSWNGKCLGSVGSGTGLNLQKCIAIETQKWNILPDTGSVASDDYKIQSTDGQTCITTTPQPVIGFLTLQTAPCEINIPTQSFRFDKVSGNVRIKPDDNAYVNFDNVCVAANGLFVTDPLVYSVNCAEKNNLYWQILLDGQFPGIDPDTDL